MFHHPDQLMTLATTHMQELKTENDQWQLATKLVQSQQRTNKDQPDKLTILRTLVSQWGYKLSRPMREAVVKLG